MRQLRRILHIINENSDMDMYKVWHVTPSRNVSNILVTGLQPQKGDRSKSANELENGIFVFPDGLSLIDALSNWLGDEFDEDEPLSILELTVPPEWVKHHDIRWEGVISHPVPPNNIRVLVPSVDDWNGNYPAEHPPENWHPED